MSASTIAAVVIIAVSGMGENASQASPVNYDPLGLSQTNSDSYSYEEYISDALAMGKVMEYSNVSVLTHGMSGLADDWLLVDRTGVTPHYYIEDFTLPYQLCNSLDRIGNESSAITVKENNIYLFNTDNSKNLSKLVKVAGQPYYIKQNLTNCSQINIDSQIVLLYDGSIGNEDETASDKSLYEDFKNSLNPILVAIAEQQHGHLPRINLIGFSRGGLINLLYAYENPRLVNNLISLGTPFMGSDWANVYMLALQLINSKKADAYADMLNPSHPAEYAEKLATINDCVNSYAIGFNQTYSFFVQSLVHTITNNSLQIDQFAEAISLGTGGYLSIENAKKLINDIIHGLINAAAIYLQYTETGLIAGIYRAWLELLDLLFDDPILTTLVNLIDGLQEIFIKDVFFGEISDFSIMTTDVCVNTNSQIGQFRGGVQLYPFDKVEIITLGDNENSNYFEEKYVVRPEQPWVAHNLEAKSPTAIEKIVSFLNENGGFHEHKYQWSTTSSKHKISCLCGAISLSSTSHSIKYEKLDDSYHNRQCAECGYSSTEIHSTTPTKINETYHLQTCGSCDYSKIDKHAFDFYGISDPLTHTLSCLCGQEGEKTAHSFVGSSRKCRVCGYNIGGTIIIGPTIPSSGGIVSIT